MLNCHDMKTGQVYGCEKCGLEMQVIKECCEGDQPAASCKCEPCQFTCCNEELKLKEA